MTAADELRAAAQLLRRPGPAAIGRYAPHPACYYAGADRPGRRHSLAGWLDGHVGSDTAQPGTAAAHALAVARAINAGGVA